MNYFGFFRITILKKLTDDCLFNRHQHRRASIKLEEHDLSSSTKKKFQNKSFFSLSFSTISDHPKRSDLILSFIKIGVAKFASDKHAN